MNNKEYIKQWYLDNKERLKEKQKKYNKTYQKGYNEDHKEERKEYMKQYIGEYVKNRKQIDPSFKLSLLLRVRFHSVIINGCKSESVLELLGCSLDECRDYIESKAKPEMNWENHGTIWEIDHIRPIASFNLMDFEQQKICFHYTNLQPLFKTTEIARSFGYIDEVGNRNKGDKQ